jgi:hypothetical protein
MTSYIPQTFQDTINSLITQITNVYRAFITHTKTFFISPNQITNTLSDGNINTTGDINLVSNTGMINLQSNNQITLSANNNLIFGTANTTSNNDLTIHSNGNLFLGSNNQLITLMQTNQTGTKPLCILWGSANPPTAVLSNSYSNGSFYISTVGILYINSSNGWKKVTTS